MAPFTRVNELPSEIAVVTPFGVVVVQLRFSWLNVHSYQVADEACWSAQKPTETESIFDVATSSLASKSCCTHNVYSQGVDTPTRQRIMTGHLISAEILLEVPFTLSISLLTVEHNGSADIRVFTMQSSNMDCMTIEPTSKRLLFRDLGESARISFHSGWFVGLTEDILSILPPSERCVVFRVADIFEHSEAVLGITSMVDTLIVQSPISLYRYDRKTWEITSENSQLPGLLLSSVTAMEHKEDLVSVGTMSGKVLLWRTRNGRRTRMSCFSASTHPVVGM